MATTADSENMRGCNTVEFISRFREDRAGPESLTAHTSESRNRDWGNANGKNHEPDLLLHQRYACL